MTETSTFGDPPPLTPPFPTCVSQRRVNMATQRAAMNRFGPVHLPTVSGRDGTSRKNKHSRRRTFRVGRCLRFSSAQNRQMATSSRQANVGGRAQVGPFSSHTSNLSPPPRALDAGRCGIPPPTAPTAAVYPICNTWPAIRRRRPKGRSVGGEGSGWKRRRSSRSPAVTADRKSACA